MFIPIPLNGASTCCFPYIPAIPIPLCSPGFCIFCMLCKPGEWNYILFSELAFAWAPIGCIIFCWFIMPCTPPLFWTYGLPPNITYRKITKLILWSFTKNGSKNKRKNEKVQKNYSIIHDRLCKERRDKLVKLKWPKTLFWS